MTTVKDEKQRIDYLLSRDDTTDRELEKIYLEAVNLLRSIISEEFNSYAVDGVLTPQDLTRRVTKKAPRQPRAVWTATGELLPSK